MLTRGCHYQEHSEKAQWSPCELPLHHGDILQLALQEIEKITNKERHSLRKVRHLSSDNYSLRSIF